MCNKLTQVNDNKRINTLLSRDSRNSRNSYEKYSKKSITIIYIAIYFNTNKLSALLVSDNFLECNKLRPNASYKVHFIQLICIFFNSFIDDKYKKSKFNYCYIFIIFLAFFYLYVY